MQPLREIGLYFGLVEPTDDERTIDSSRSGSSRLLRSLAIAFLMFAIGAMIAVLVQLLL